MNIVNTYALPLPAVDAAAIGAGLVLIHVLTRDAMGRAAVYTGAVSRRALDSDAARQRAAESIALSGEKQTEATARDLFAFPDWEYRA